MLVFFLFIKLVEIQNLIIWKKGSTQQPTRGNTEYSFEIQEFYINFARNNSILNFVKKTNQFSYGNRRTVHYPDGIRDEFYSIEQTNSIYFFPFFSFDCLVPSLYSWTLERNGIVPNVADKHWAHMPLSTSPASLSAT